MSYCFIENINIKRGDRVLVRADLNIPIVAGRIQINKRVLSIISTIDYLYAKGAKIILLSHLGRPKGKVDKELSMLPLAHHLTKIWSHAIQYVPDCIGEGVEKRILEMKDGECLLLENVRFYPGETQNDKDFAKALAKNIDVYINEAFGVAHRLHASVHAITEFIPKCAIGFVFQDEINKLDLITKKVKHPFVLISGGAKIKDKIPFLTTLVEKADKILLGGAMVCTFLKALDISVGKSLVSNDQLPEVKELLEINKNNKKICIPEDFLVAQEIDFKQLHLKGLQHVNYNEIPDDSAVVDIGPKTIATFCKILSEAATIYWNGPLGIVEIKDSSHGTVQIAQFLAQLTQQNVHTIIGGGNSASIVEDLSLNEKMTHISTGGGASMYYIEKQSLPCLDLLSLSHC